MPDPTGISAMGERLLGGMIARKLAAKGQKELAMRVGLPILLEQKRSEQEHSYRMQEIAEKHKSDLALRQFDVENEKPAPAKKPEPFSMYVKGKNKQFVFDPNTGELIETGEIPKKGKEPKEPAETNIADVGALGRLLTEPNQLTKADQAILDKYGLVQKWAEFDLATKEGFTTKQGEGTAFEPLASLWERAPKEGGGFWGGGTKVEPSTADYLRQLAITPDEVNEALLNEARAGLAEQRAALLPGLVRGMPEEQALGVVDSLNTSIDQDIQAMLKAVQQPETAENPEEQALDELLNKLERRYGGK